MDLLAQIMGFPKFIIQIPEWVIKAAQECYHQMQSQELGEISIIDLKAIILQDHQRQMTEKWRYVLILRMLSINITKISFFMVVLKND